MVRPVTYSLYIDDEEYIILITPVIQRLPGGEMYATGVYKLSDRGLNMGDIVFDDSMKQWEYTGLGDLTHKEAEEIAGFIRGYKDADDLI